LPQNAGSRPGRAHCSHATERSGFAAVDGSDAKGIPVATLAIGKPGAANAALFAAEILALNDAALHERLAAWRAKRAQEVLESKLPE